MGAGKMGQRVRDEECLLLFQMASRAFSSEPLSEGSQQLQKIGHHQHGRQECGSRGRQEGSVQKCLFCKHEDLALVLSTHKKPCIVVLIVIPLLGGRDREILTMQLYLV